MKTRQNHFHLAAAAAAFFTAACGDLLDVTNPGPVADDDLNDPSAMTALVVGMSGDLSAGLSTTAIWGSVWSDDLTHSGTLGAPTVFARGIIQPMDVNGWWGDMHRARWVAESGILRMQEVLGDGFESSKLASRAYLLAGFANRILGENACDAVFDGGAPGSYAEHFRRAEGQFDEALRLADAQGSGTFATAARAGRAQVRAALGDWSGAVEDAEAIPIDFRYDAQYSLNTGRESNGWEAVTLVRGEYTVWGSPWHEVDDDPRIPWEDVMDAGGGHANAANGSTPWTRQQKYLDNAANIALAKGTEMLLIRAEEALRRGEVGEAMGFVNEVRDHFGLGPIEATDEAQAWPILQDERGKTLWLEGRRFWDLRRWNEEQGPAHHAFLADRDGCVPISVNERLSNPNIS